MSDLGRDGLRLVSGGVEFVLPDGGRLGLFDRLDLAVAPGESVAVVGPSGSGKSTLLNVFGLFVGLTSGRLLVDGHDTADWDDRQCSTYRNQRLGFVFQDFLLDESATVIDNLLLPGLVRPARARPAAVPGGGVGLDPDQLLENVGMQAMHSRRVSVLSGGQRQRVGIARALSMRPDFLLVDEPTGALDAATAAGIADLLFHRVHTLGAGMVLATHDLGLADRADRVVNLVGTR